MITANQVTSPRDSESALIEKRVQFQTPVRKP